MRYRNLYRLYSKKEKIACCAISKLSNCFIHLIESGSNWYQIGSKACYILKVSKFYREKGYLY